MGNSCKLCKPSNALEKKPSFTWIMYIYLSALSCNLPVISSLQLKFEIFDLIGIFEHVFDQLKVNPSKHKVGIWYLAFCL